MMTAKRLATSLCVAAVFSVGALASESPVLERIVASGKIRIGMSGDQAPFNVKNKAGELIGFEVDLANFVADALGVEVEFVTKAFPDLLGALKDGEVDIVMSGMTITGGAEPRRGVRRAVHRVREIGSREIASARGR